MHRMTTRLAAMVIGLGVLIAVGLLVWPRSGLRYYRTPAQAVIGMCHPFTIIGRYPGTGTNSVLIGWQAKDQQMGDGWQALVAGTAHRYRVQDCRRFGVSHG